jgi:hypothetical protein
MTSAATQISMTVSALLAFQRLAEISRLPAHLRIRPQLLLVGDQPMPITEAEQEILIAGGLLSPSEGIDQEAVVMLRALNVCDAEVNVTLARKGLSDTFVVLARRNNLFVAALRCDDEVIIDAYTHLSETDVVSLLADTIAPYLFAETDGEGEGYPFERGRFPMNTVTETMAGVDPQDWVRELGRHGVPAAIAGVLLDSETNMTGRIEVAAYLNQEGGRVAPDTIGRVTNTPSGALMTSFASDNNQRSWVTVEPYDRTGLERLILGVIRSVPGAAWFDHKRTD